MTDSEWESLCDGCGKCCLNKLEEEETDRTFYTDVGCRLLDGETCRCRDYENRQNRSAIACGSPREPQEHHLAAAVLRLCAGVARPDLYWWHPLVSGDPETVHTAGVSVRGRVGASEVDVPDEDLEDYIVNWPLKLPKAARQRR